MVEKKIFIKNMVCHRCVLAVEGILRKLSIPFLKVDLGEVSVNKEIVKAKLASLNEELSAIGFELLDDKKKILVERIKNSILKYLHQLPEIAKIKLSIFISESLKLEYTHLSGLFSSIEGSTIEHYFINLRIEKVKELIVYDQLSLSEIAFNLGYSNVHHLSTQFKKTTGLTPTYFKKIGTDKRKAIGKS